MFMMDRHSERAQIYKLKNNTPADALNLHNITNIFDAIKYSLPYAIKKIVSCQVCLLQTGKYDF